ncbi:MAG: hypothetical protein ACRCSG_09985 [Cellulosilyticaceae bacterium]
MSLCIAIFKMIKEQINSLKGMFSRPYHKDIKTHHYKCKMNHRHAKINVGTTLLMIHQKYREETLDYKCIEQVSIKEKCWSIRVIIRVTGNTFYCDFPSMKQATKFYEELIYRKVENQ